MLEELFIVLQNPITAILLLLLPLCSIIKYPPCHHRISTFFPYIENHFHYHFYNSDTTMSPYPILFFLSLTLIPLAITQHIPQLQTNMAYIAPVPYTPTASPYRNLTLHSRSPNSLIANAQLVFSFANFNYFVNQVHCYENIRQATTVIVTCSSNVYKLSYMLLQKGPNIFVWYTERTYEAGGKGNDVVDVSDWMKQVSFPLKSLLYRVQLNTTDIIDLPTNNDEQPLYHNTYYHITLDTFLSGIQTHLSPNITNTTAPNITKNTSTSIPTMLEIKLLPIYWNISLSRNLLLEAPVAINVTTSPILKKVSFFSVVCIHNMPSLNLIFSQLEFESLNGYTNYSDFIGTSELTLSFELAQQPNFPSSPTLPPTFPLTSLSFQTTYNSSAPFNIPFTSIHRLGPQKLVKYFKGSNVAVKMKRLERFFYKRCNGTSLGQYQKVFVPVEGRLYWIVPAGNHGLAITVVDSKGNTTNTNTDINTNTNGTTNTNTTTSNTNTPYLTLSPTTASYTSSQAFYFQFLGQQRYKIFHHPTNTPLKSNKTQLNQTIKLAWNLTYESDNLWDIMIKYQGNRTKYFINSMSSMAIGVLNSKPGSVQNGNLIVQKNLTLPNGAADLLWQIIQMQSPTQSNQFALIQSQLANSTNLFKISSQSAYLMYYPQYPKFVTLTYQPSLSPYALYSPSTEQCLLKSVLQTYSANTTATPNQSLQLSYFFNIKITNWLESLMFYQAYQQNYSVFNTSSSEFSKGMVYGLAVEGQVLKEFLEILRQKDWNGFQVDVKEIISLLALRNISDNATESHGNVTVQLNTTDDTNQSTKTNQTIIPQPILITPLPTIHGCLNQQPLTSPDLRENTLPTCLQCQQPLILFPVCPTLFPNKICHINKCICPMGMFLSVSEGKCIECELHPTNCSVFFRIQSSRLVNQKAGDLVDVVVAVQMMSGNGYVNQVVGRIMALLRLLSTQIDDQHYPISQVTQTDCDQINITQKKTCFTLYINSIPKRNHYHLTIKPYPQTQTLSSNQTPQHPSYLLINQTLPPLPSTTPSPPQLTLTLPFTPTPSLFLAQFHPLTVTLTHPFSITNTLEPYIAPIVTSLNYTSSLVVLVTPFLLDKVNLFSILQTGSMLYMIRFLKWSGYNDCQINIKVNASLDGQMSDNGQCNQENQIQQLVSKLFLFRSQPLLNPFSVTPHINTTSTTDTSILNLPQTLITLPCYQPPFTHNSLHNSSTSYPALLTSSAISSLETNQNYLTLTLNSLANILLQIIVLQLITSVGIWLCSTTNYQTQQKEQIKVKVAFAPIRHQLSYTQHQLTLTDPKIQWLPLPKPHQCITVKILPPKSQLQHQPNTDHQTLTKKISEHFTNEENITFKLHILFLLTTIRSKKAIFYTSWILMQLTSQTYLIYFELVKPFSVEPSNSALQSLDGIFSSLVFLALLLLPVFLLSLQPLYLHKLAAITYKNPNNHSYSLQQLFLDFCVVYYEGLVIAYSVALGKDLFWQSLPIAVYQTVKMAWIWSRMKIIQKLKSLIMLLLFSTIILTLFIPKNYSLTYSIAQHAITTCIYLVLLIQLIKILKFFIVTLINLIKTKIQLQPPLQQSTQTTTINQKHLEVISLIEEQPQNNQKPVNYLSKMPFTEYPSEKTLLPRKTKEKHLEKIKQKSHFLKQLQEMRQSLKNDLQQMKINRNKEKQQKYQNHYTQKQSYP